MVYLKSGSSTFCYVGHKTNGSMGDSVSASSNVLSFDCTNTPSISICGYVPVSASTTTSTISANPTSILANGVATSTITVQLKDGSGNTLTTSGGTVVISTTQGTISSVTDNNDGTYKAILTSSISVTTATLSFTIASVAATSTATIAFTQPPLITTTGTLSAFASCQGKPSTSQSFHDSAVGITSNLIVTAPTGYELSKSSAGVYTATLSFIPTSGVIRDSLVWVRLTSGAANNASGNISSSATGATTTNLATGTGVVNVLPTSPILSIMQAACGASSGTVAITSSTTGLTFSTDGTNYAAYSSAYIVNAGASYSITAKNTTSGCVSVATTGTLNAALTVPAAPSVNVTQAACGASTGTIAITSSTTGLTFSTDGTNYAAYSSAYSVNPGASYSITAKNTISGCVSVATTGTLNAALTVPAAPSVNVIQAACGASSGTVAITSSTTGLTFSTDGTNYAAYSSAYSVNAGASYSITAKNTTSGCVSVATTGSLNAALTVPAAPSVNVTQAACGASSGTVAITSSTTGLTFSTDGINYAAYSSAYSVNAGASYSITAKNTTSGCVSVATTGTLNTAKSASGSSSSVSVCSSSLPYTWNSNSYSAAGTYTVHFTNSVGCDSAATLVLTVNSSPTVTTGNLSSVSTSATSFNLSYTLTGGSADEYSVFTVSPTAMTGFTPISNANLVSSPIAVTIPASSANTYSFGMTVKNSATGCFSTTETFNLTVADFNPGTISASQSICSGTIPSQLVNVTTASGAGTFTYYWQKSTTSAIAGFSNISNASVTSYQPDSLKQTAYFRRAAFDGTTTAYSNVVTITVKPITWIGAVSEDWNEAGNWCGNIPALGDNVVIDPNPTYSPKLVYDVVVNNLAYGNVTPININGHKFTVEGALIGNAFFKGDSLSFLTINNTGNFTIAFTPDSQRLGSLVIKNANLTVSSQLSIYDTLSLNNATLHTSDFLVLKSNVNNTARLAPLDANSSVQGKVTVERYYPNRRCWRFIGYPITISNPPSINESLQEGAISSAGYNPDPHPGFGCHITGGTVAHGFDQDPKTISSMLYVNSSSNWGTVTNTLTTKITDYNAYMIFVRGPRSYNIATTTDTTTPVETVLRVKGNLKQGTQAILPINPTGWTALGNPYPSPLSFPSIYANSTNIANRLRVWDPTLGGTWGRGGYVTVDYDISSGTYSTTPTSNMNEIMQSGQAIYVQSADGISAGSIKITENNKEITQFVSNNKPFNIQTKDLTLKMDLLIQQVDGSYGVADGILERYNSTYSNNITPADAIKGNNTFENISINSLGNKLTIERRSLPSVIDSLKLLVTGLKSTTNYQYKILPQQLDSLQLVAVLHDNYLNSTTVLKNNDTTLYNFNVNSAVAASTASDRFFITFNSIPASLPLTFVSVKAKKLGTNANLVLWNVSNQVNILKYEVERKTANTEFASIATVDPKNTNTYSFVDNAPSDKQISYYRINATDKSGKTIYSSVAAISPDLNSNVITVMPNPIVNNKIHFTINNQNNGRYFVSITDMRGRMLYTTSIGKINDNQEFEINTKGKLTTGEYILTISNNEQNYNTKIMINNEQ